MNRKLVCLLLPFLLAGSFTSCISSGVQPPVDTGHSQMLYQTMTYTYKTDASVFESYLTTGLHSGYLILANKSHPLGSDYAPQDLTSLTCPTNLGKTVELEAQAAQALYAMLGEMAADGVTDISVTSGYRTYAYQAQLFSNYVSREMSRISDDAIAYFGNDYIQANYVSLGKTGLSREDAEAVAGSYSAIAGTSEHQTGLCVDFVTSTADLSLSFANTAAFDWLSQNAYRFGFILRYPADKVDITKYTYEPWHYRFVGREVATEIHFGNLCLEEYLSTPAQ